MCRSPQENVAFEFLLVYPEIPYMSFCLNRMVSEMGGKWPHSHCFVGCSRISSGHGTNLLYSFFSMGFVSVHVVPPYSCMDTKLGRNHVLFYRIDTTSI